MPTVQLENGSWIQDSSVIIDYFEDQALAPPIVPKQPTRQLASYVLEVFADEWLPMIALYSRWSNPRNEIFALNDFARSGFP